MLLRHDLSSKPTSDKMKYEPDNQRYSRITYNSCGKSGLKIPPLSLGLWHNFGSGDNADTGRMMIHTAFDHGITHFDLANNYGPPPGSAESFFGKILKKDLAGYRDEIIVATKAGHLMWEGPYGDGGSRKYLLSSLDQSLQRLQLDYVDIFYSHRYDPETPLEETIGALISAVRSGKALYAGISKYPPHAAREACRLFREERIPCILHQVRYNMLDRIAETDVFPAASEEGLGCIVFSPLAQGMLTEKYVKGIPSGSRAAGNSIFLNTDKVQENIEKIRQLSDFAAKRGQPLSQMAIAWALYQPSVTSAIIGASRVEQITDCLKALDNRQFTDEELQEIDRICLL